jgi:hypothetical protein
MQVFHCLFESVLEVGGHRYYDFINRHNTYACLFHTRTWILAGILRGRFVLIFSMSKVIGHVVDIDKVVDLLYITFLFNNFLFNYNPEQI